MRESLLTTSILLISTSALAKEPENQKYKNISANNKQRFTQSADNSTIRCATLSNLKTNSGAINGNKATMASNSVLNRTKKAISKTKSATSKAINKTQKLGSIVLNSSKKAYNQVNDKIKKLKNIK